MTKLTLDYIHMLGTMKSLADFHSDARLCTDLCTKTHDCLCKVANICKNFLTTESLKCLS